MSTLERLKELQAAATPGPWVNDGHSIYGPEHELSLHPNGRVYITRVVQGTHRADPDLEGGRDRFGFDSLADAELIVTMRNNAEALIEVAEAAKEVTIIWGIALFPKSSAGLPTTLLQAALRMVWLKRARLYRPLSPS